MLVLLFVALWFILRGDSLYVFPCVILFLCFSVLLVLRLPRLGKRELILMLFVRLFGLCLFRFVGFLFLLGSGKGCGLWLWHSLDFSLTFLAICKSALTVIVALPGLFSPFFDIVKRVSLETYYGGHIIPVVAWQFRARANGAITDHCCLWFNCQCPWYSYYGCNKIPVHGWYHVKLLTSLDTTFCTYVYWTRLSTDRLKQCFSFVDFCALLIDL